MFSQAKAYAAGIGIIVVLAIVGYFLYSYHSSQKENTALTTEVTVQKVEIKDQATTIEVQGQSGAITTGVITKHAEDSKQVQHKFDEVSSHEQAQIDVIHNQPAVEPTAEVKASLPEGVTAQQAQVSAVRIESLWDSYCLAAANDPSCKKVGS